MTIFVTDDIIFFTLKKIRVDIKEFTHSVKIVFVFHAIVLNDTIDGVFSYTDGFVYIGLC